MTAGDGVQNTVYDYRLADSTRALAILAQHFGLLAPTEVRVGLTDDLMALLAAARTRVAALAIEPELLTEEDRHQRRALESGR